VKGYWIGILGTGALVVSAFGQNGVRLQALAINTGVAIVSSDNSSRATILEPQVELSPGPSHVIQGGDLRPSGLQFQLLSTGHQLLDHQPREETEPVSEVQVSGDTLVVSLPDASPDVLTAIVEYLDLTPVQIAAIQAQIAVQRGQVESLMQQLTNNRWELIATTLKGQFDIHQVRKLAAQQARILEPLIVANARLQAEIYKILTSSNSESLMK
jgi:hypothetical protein